VFYAFGKLIFKLILGFVGRPVITGKEHFPNSGPVIVVANHASLLDPFLLAVLWPHRITFLAAAYLFSMPVVGALLRAAAAIPVRTEGSELAGMRAALRILQKGGTIGLFPEGRVVQADRLGPFQTGWAYLALKAGVPVLPVAIKGSSQALPLGTYLPRRRKIHIHISAPWAMEMVRRPEQESLAALNAKLNSQIQQMLEKL